jgi:hypothetical protein
MPCFKKILLYKEFLGRMTHVRKDRYTKKHVQYMTDTQTRLYHMVVYQCQKGETFLHLKLSLKHDVHLVGSGFQNKDAVQFKYFWRILTTCLCPLLASCVSERAILSVGATAVPAAEFCSLSRRSCFALA